MLLTTARLIAAALLVASAAAFVTGTTIERHMANSESQMARQERQHHSQTGEPHGDSSSAEGVATSDSRSTHVAEHTSETLLGVNPEAPGLVAIAVAMSLVLAALILIARSRLLASGVALVMLAFLALDIREVTHQLNESRSGLAALAATVALLHVAAGAAALVAAPRWQARVREQ